ncbi:hypothetical protein HY485_04965 [Candidatus Woesearchaeota archaeon]|nr:hypothetical protein [Candidatus Woesearchaeota archaeon]
MLTKAGVRDYLASFVLAGAVVFGQSGCTKADGDDKTQQTSIDELTQAEVNTLMQRSSVDEILKEEYASGRIKKVEYKDGKTNFKDLVYQEQLPQKDRKPVIMLVADGDGIGWFDKEKYEFAKGDGVVLKKLVAQYSDFKFVVYDPSIAPDFRETGKNTVVFGQELLQEGVMGSPSVFLYNLFDVTTNETETTNDGRIKIIDKIKGGMNNGKDTVKLHKDITKYWLPSNITSINHSFVWRSQNSDGIKWSKIKYGNGA